MPEKEFDCVAFMRKRREEIDEKIKDMREDEIISFFNESAKKFFDKHNIKPETKDEIRNY